MNSIAQVVPITNTNNFELFALPLTAMRALQALNFKNPTPIQEQAIPPSLFGQDVIGIAQTGTGKTAAFCLPIFAKFEKDPAARALVLAPTRELALQIDQFWRKLTQFRTEHRSALLIGGASMGEQVRALRMRPRLIIATPGRLLDHIRRRSVDVSKTSMLVMDEADRMLDMGFSPQIKEIARYLPKARQTLLFTATWDSRTDQLSKQYLNKPFLTSVTPASQAAPLIEQKVVQTSSNRKNETLLDEINVREGSVLVFVRTKHRTDRVTKYLASYGLEVNRLHGGRTQAQRNSALSAFRNGRVRVLVATDIAARGIDVAKIAHVINYDLPQVAEDYIHRIGRTGRAGQPGNAVSLVTPEDRELWRAIARVLEKGGSKVPQLNTPIAASKPKPKKPFRPYSKSRRSRSRPQIHFAR